jgi:hypothetical protein
MEVVQCLAFWMVKLHSGQIYTEAGFFCAVVAIIQFIAAATLSELQKAVLQLTAIH